MRSERNRRQWRWLCCSILLGALLPLAAGRAATLEIRLQDQQGLPVDDAVVHVVRVDGAVPASVPQDLLVDQVDEAFVPHVRAATVGSRISFPNSDHIRHHVYSFSEVRSFELPLYIGIPAEPVVFERPGLVTLGCNIHDHMLGYILVLDSPWFAEVRGGQGRIEGLPAGQLELEIWHPRLGAGAPLRRTLSAAADSILELDASLELRAERQLRRAPRRSRSGY